MSAPAITLYTGQSPNGIKASILMEELGVPYTARKMDMVNNEHKSEWFLKINPNGRIPALTDTLPDGSEIHLFESGSILQYLIERYDTDNKISYPRGTKEHYDTNSWLFFQMAGVGPMQGQANYFARYSAEPNPAAAKRYNEETKRLYGVLDKHLAETGRPYLVGDRCTVADIAHWGWIAVARWAHVELDDFPALKAWEERMFHRPGVEKGRHVPDAHHREMLQDPVKMAAFETQARDFYKKYNKDPQEEQEAKA